MIVYNFKFFKNKMYNFGSFGQGCQVPIFYTQADSDSMFRIAKNLAYLEGPRTPGPGGLPCGVTGRVLTLFSGGIDSPAATWLMMRRGCTTAFGFENSSCSRC